MKRFGVNTFVSAVLSISLVFAGVLSFRPQISFATSTCGTEIYTFNSDGSNSRVFVDFLSSDNQITVTGQNGWTVTKVELDVENDNHGGYYQYATGNLTNFNPNPGNDIDSAKITVYKSCATQTPSSTPTTAPTATPDERKVTICHATGSEQNPWEEITASYNAIYNPNAGHFNEPGTQATGHEDDIEGPCPTATPTSIPSWTPTPQPTIDPCDGPCPTSTSEPTETPTATETPNSDLCANIKGIQYSVPEGKHLDASGKNCVEFGVPGSPESPATSSQVLGTSTGQVLGASTMAGTGAVEDALFNSMFTLGSLLTSFGIMKNGKKKA